VSFKINLEEEEDVDDNNGNRDDTVDSRAFADLFHGLTGDGDENSSPPMERNVLPKEEYGTKDNTTITPPSTNEKLSRYGTANGEQNSRVNKGDNDDDTTTDSMMEASSALYDRLVLDSLVQPSSPHQHGEQKKPVDVDGNEVNAAGAMERSVVAEEEEEEHATTNGTTDTTTTSNNEVEQSSCGGFSNGTNDGTAIQTTQNRSNEGQDTSIMDSMMMDASALYDSLLDRSIQSSQPAQPPSPLQVGQDPTDGSDVKTTTAIDSNNVVAAEEEHDDTKDSVETTSTNGEQSCGLVTTDTNTNTNATITVTTNDTRKYSANHTTNEDKDLS